MTVFQEGFYFFVKEARAESVHSFRRGATMRRGVVWKLLPIDATTKWIWSFFCLVLIKKKKRKAGTAHGGVDGGTHFLPMSFCWEAMETEPWSKGKTLASVWNAAGGKEKLKVSPGCIMNHNRYRQTNWGSNKIYLAIIGFFKSCSFCICF